MQTEPEQLDEVLDRLQRIETALDQLLTRQVRKDWYTVDEFAALVGKAPFTVREWARLGRIRAEKRGSGRGRYQEWIISSAEQDRYARFGLLPILNGQTLSHRR